MIKKTMSIFEETLLASALSDFSDVPPEEKIDYTFSEKFEQKAGELIKKSRSKTWHRVNTTAKKLLIAAIITALLATSAMAIPEVREEVMKIFAHDTGTYYYFTADEDTVKKAPKEIELIYSTTYIPAGFAQSNVTYSRDYVSFEYSSTDGDYIGYKQETMPDDPSHDVGPYVDSEGSKVAYVRLNGHDVMQIVFGESGEKAVAFIWTNEDYFFTMYCSSYDKITQARNMLISIEPDQQLTDAVMADLDSN